MLRLRQPYLVAIAAAIVAMDTVAIAIAAMATSRFLSWPIARMPSHNYGGGAHLPKFCGDGVVHCGARHHATVVGEHGPLRVTARVHACAPVSFRTKLLELRSPAGARLPVR